MDRSENGNVRMMIHTNGIGNIYRHILHVDADAFFVSVEQALHPELKGKPVMVGGSERGVVTAASYEARAFGVRSAMPVVQAKRLCPHGIFLPPQFEAYQDFSHRMFDIMRIYSPAVETASIDEGYVDLTGVLRLHRAPPWDIAHNLLQRIREELHINASGGLACSKVAAKMAAGIAKPNGLLYLEPDKAMDLLGALPVQSIPGVGKRALALLARHGIHTVGDVARSTRSHMKSILGQWGVKLLDIARGADGAPVRTNSRRVGKSYSKGRTLHADTLDYTFVRFVMGELTEKLGAKLRRDNVGASTISLHIRYADFSEASRSLSLSEPTNLNCKLLASLDRLFWKTLTKRIPIRRIGVHMSGIDVPAVQWDLFDAGLPAKRRVDCVVDEIRDKFGFHAVKPSSWTTACD